MEPRAINLQWLVNLRWGAVVGQSSIMIAGDLLLDLHLPLAWMLGLVAVEAASNVVVAFWLRRSAGERVFRGQWVFAVLMGLDFVILTALLALSGGPYNPFCFIYLIYIALAAISLRPAMTWLLTALAAALFGSLFLLGEGDPQHDHAAMQLHVKGMWFAFAVAAVFIVYFVHRVTSELQERDAEVSRFREQSGRAERLASLGTLAAGAAHELSTPLSTIALVAKELERRIERMEVADEAMFDDARLIRSQVEQCREILAQLSADAGQPLGEPLRDVRVSQLVDSALERIRQADRVKLQIPSQLQTASLLVPAEALSRALRAVVKNALEASSESVEMRVEHNGSWCFQVVDHGEGMNPETLARAGEPFFTTKAPGEGMGLGLFLARALTEQLGGAFEIDSVPGHGTAVRLVLPEQPPQVLHE